MAIHKTLRIITSKFPTEPTHIFTDCLNCIYVINTQIKHPTQHNNHADKTILKMLENRTQTTTIYKVKAHMNIEGNEQADALAKNGIKNGIDSPLKHSNSHTLHHITSKKTYGLAQQKDQIHAQSDP